MFDEKEYQRQYRLAHKEESKKYKKEWYLENKNEISQVYQESYKEDPEKFQLKSKKYRDNNQEKCKTAQQIYHSNHKEEAKDYKEQWRMDNPDKIAAHDEKWRERCMINLYRSRDKKKGFECDLTEEWMKYNITSKPCVYCGDTEQIGCDRIDNNKGHTMDNVMPCCMVCNVTRNKNFSMEEMHLIGATIRTIKENRLLKVS